MNKNMKKQLMAMQNKLTKKMQEFDNEEFEFDYQKSIKIIIKGNLEIIKMNIDKQLIDPDDKTMLEEMICEAINEAISAVNEEKEKITQEFMPSF